ncbi:MAG: flagellar motor switch protein FliN [Acidobacteriaceae bacterium]
MDTSQSARVVAFSDALSRVLVTAISDACGTPWLVTALPDAESVAEEADPVRFILTCDGSLRGDCLLQFRRSEAITLASKCLGESAAEFAEEQSAALLKIIQTSGSGFPAALASQYGAFTIHAGPTSEPPSNPTCTAEFTASDDSGNRASIKMFLNTELDQALASHPASGPEAQESGQPDSSDPTLLLPEAKNLDLVMEVELNVTLRFGQRQLTLREVLELTSGSVIELDRQVEEPVELLLEGKVIARGEAVVIDGNYGLRVTEVPQPAPPPIRQ